MEIQARVFLSRATFLEKQNNDRSGIVFGITQTILPLYSLIINKPEFDSGFFYLLFLGCKWQHNHQSEAIP